MLRTMRNTPSTRATTPFSDSYRTHSNFYLSSPSLFPSFPSLECPPAAMEKEEDNKFRRKKLKDIDADYLSDSRTPLKQKQNSQAKNIVTFTKEYSLKDYDGVINKGEDSMKYDDNDDDPKSNHKLSEKGKEHETKCLPNSPLQK